MYKEYSAAEYKSNLSLPENYRVDSFFVVGTWDRAKQLNILEEILKEKKISYSIKPLPNFLGRMVEIEVNDKIIWFDVAYGGALLSEFLHLACLFGSKRNILIGTCGGLKRGVKTGDVLVPTFSLGDGTTANMYQREVEDNLYPSNSELRGKIITNLLRLNIKTIEEKSVTCQAMLAETWEDVVSWSDQGFAGVEMEAATVFSVSNHFKVKSGAMLMVSDNLIEKETVLDTSYSGSKEIRVKSKKAIFETALNLLIEV